MKSQITEQNKKTMEIPDLKESREVNTVYSKLKSFFKEASLLAGGSLLRTACIVVLCIALLPISFTYFAVSYLQDERIMEKMKTITFCSKLKLFLNDTIDKAKSILFLPIYAFYVKKYGGECDI